MKQSSLIHAAIAAALFGAGLMLVPGLHVGVDGPATLAFGGLLFAAVMFMMGQTERVLYGLVGAGIGGLSFIIIKVMFSTAGGSSDVDSLQMGSGSGN